MPGYPMVVLSNGSPRMVQAAVRSAGLESWFEQLISVDEVQTYKPSPLVYRHAAERLGRAIGEIRLISSNPFDVIGATAVGMQVAWLDRRRCRIRHARATAGHGPEEPDRTGRPASGDVVALEA